MGFWFGGLCVPFVATATAPALPAKESAAPERHLLEVFILNLSSSTSGDIFRCQFTPVFFGYAMAFHSVIPAWVVAGWYLRHVQE